MKLRIKESNGYLMDVDHTELLNGLQEDVFKAIRDVVRTLSPAAIFLKTFAIEKYSGYDMFGVRISPTPSQNVFNVDDFIDFQFSIDSKTSDVDVIVYNEDNELIEHTKLSPVTSKVIQYIKGIVSNIYC